MTDRSPETFASVEEVFREWFPETLRGEERSDFCQWQSEPSLAEQLLRELDNVIDDDRP